MFEFSSQFVAMTFSANLYLLKPNYIRSSSLIGEKIIKVNNLFFRTWNALSLQNEGRGTKLNFSQNIPSSLSLDIFLHFTVPILRSDTASQIMPFSRECFFTPLWSTIKNSGRAGSRQEDRLEKIITK